MNTVTAAEGRRAAHVDAGSFLARARGIVGAENLLTDEASRKLYSVDFSEIPLSTAIAIIRPRTTQEVSQIVRAAGETGIALTARGGGMSYTLGYAPRDENTAILDMKRMNSIRINAEDRLVEIEPGATWAEVHAALQPTGLRIGCMGTMSGIAATIGGGLGCTSGCAATTRVSISSTNCVGEPYATPTDTIVRIFVLESVQFVTSFSRNLLLGMINSRFAPVLTRVLRAPMCSIVPYRPLTSTRSPCRIGRSARMIKPLIKLLMMF